MALNFSDSLRVIIAKPLDDKTVMPSITERDAIPLAQRYRGMQVLVQNTGNTPPDTYWLPTDDLSNTGWELREFGDAPDLSNLVKTVNSIGVDASQNVEVDASNIKLDKTSPTSKTLDEIIADLKQQISEIEVPDLSGLVKKINEPNILYGTDNSAVDTGYGIAELLDNGVWN